MRGVVVMEGVLAREAAMRSCEEEELRGAPLERDRPERHAVAVLPVPFPVEGALGLLRVPCRRILLQIFLSLLVCDRICTDCLVINGLLSSAYPISERALESTEAPGARLSAVRTVLARSAPAIRTWS